VLRRVFPCAKAPNRPPNHTARVHAFTPPSAARLDQATQTATTTPQPSQKFPQAVSVSVQVPQQLTQPLYCSRPYCSPLPPVRYCLTNLTQTKPLCCLLYLLVLLLVLLGFSACLRSLVMRRSSGIQYVYVPPLGASCAPCPAVYCQAVPQLTCTAHWCA
jgi:hypothetical protein